jgi:hypothetical protein
MHFPITMLDSRNTYLRNMCIKHYFSYRWDVYTHKCSECCKPICEKTYYAQVARIF